MRCTDIVVRECLSKKIVGTFFTIESMRLYIPVYSVQVEYATVSTNIDTKFLYSCTHEQFNTYFMELLLKQSKEVPFKKLS